MKIISTLLGLSTATARVQRQARPEWLRDPLAHPDLDAMSERELADLPFSRGHARSCAQPQLPVIERRRHSADPEGN
jgi:hypothetical protein